jgi:pilus assembly protein Flp/PilA
MRRIESRNILRRLARDRSGATAAEYGLIAAGIAVAVINVVQGVGANIAEILGFLAAGH